MKRLTILAVSAAVMTTAQAADGTVQRYTIKSGEVQYQISGGGDVMGMAKIQTTGSKSLIFKNYGSMQRDEEQRKEVTSGMDNMTNETHTLDQLDNTTSYKVNFEHKSITKSTDPVAIMYVGKNMGKDAAKTLVGFGGKKTGKTDEIQGYTCNVWAIMGAKQCMYKDQIPLWIETDVMGLKTKITAVSVKFDQAIPDSRFALPDYPIRDMTMSKKEIQQTIEMSKMMQQSQANLKQQMQKQGKDLNQASEADVQAAMMAAMSQNKGAQSQLEKMKADFPQMLALGEEYRDCLQGADTKSAAQACQKTANAKAERLGIADEEDMGDDLGSWSAAEKKAYLKEMNEGMSEMKKALPCIQKAENMMAVMGCYGN